MVSSNPMMQGAIDALNPTKNTELVAKAADKAFHDKQRQGAATSLVDSLIDDARDALEQTRDSGVITEWILENRSDVIAEWMYNDHHADELWPKLLCKQISIQELHEAEEGERRLSDLINQELVLYFTTELEPLKPRIEYVLSCETDPHPFKSEADEHNFDYNQSR